MYKTVSIYGFDSPLELPTPADLCQSINPRVSAVQVCRVCTLYGINIAGRDTSQTVEQPTLPGWLCRVRTLDTARINKYRCLTALWIDSSCRNTFQPLERMMTNTPGLSVCQVCKLEYGVNQPILPIDGDFGGLGTS